MTITININRKIMHRSINMYNLKRLYWFKLNNLTYLDYDRDFFNNEQCNFKVETISQNKGPQTYRTVACNRADRHNNQQVLPCSLQSRRICLCPQRPVRSAAYSQLLLLLLIDFVDCARSHGLPNSGYDWCVNDAHH